MDHPTSDVDVDVDEELQEAAERSVELASGEDFGVRVAATLVSMDMEITIRQKEVAERAETLQ
jgi:hypothetical protein